MKLVYSLIQLLGFFLLFVFPAGTIIGLVLLIWGGIQYRAVSKQIECPKCKEKIKPNAEICKHCGSDIKPAAD
jgi:hypothetical protein